jgi:hypothetical protein
MTEDRVRTQRRPLPRARPLRKRGSANEKIPSGSSEEAFGGISIGDSFGKLKVIRRRDNRGQHAFWECQCECDSAKLIEVRGDHLRDGSTISCGCAQSDYQEARLRQIEKSVSLRNFGRMFVLGTTREFMGQKQVHAVCVCRYCGSTSVERARDVLRRNFRGCRCIYEELISDRISQYGYPPRPGETRKIKTVQEAKMEAEWRTMIARCHDPKNRDYPDYGGRGIFVCQRWRRSFKAFLDDNGVRPLEKSLDRIDNEGPYSPENCSWATSVRQTRHRRNTIFVWYEGENIPLAELAERLDITYAQVYRRHRAGGTPDGIAAWAMARKKA